MAHRLPRSPHNPDCPSPIEGYALFEALCSTPIRELAHEALLVDRAGQFRWEPLEWNIHGYWVCPALEDDLRWYVVGWRYTNGSWPSGPPHAIDLTRVDFERCPRPRRRGPSGMN